jgi:hypothetical protein
MAETVVKFGLLALVVVFVARLIMGAVGKVGAPSTGCF